MIKRFASHFIFLPGHGYLKQYVVGVEEGQVVSAFPLTEEIEGVEWFPGVIAFLNNEEDISKGYSGIFQKANEVLQELPEVFCQETFPSGINAYLLYPFDFTTMLPVDGTRHKLLREQLPHSVTRTFPSLQDNWEYKVCG